MSRSYVSVDSTVNYWVGFKRQWKRCFGAAREVFGLAADNTTANLIHDTPLWAAVAYVAEKIGETKNTDFFSETRNLIRQKALDGELTIWGKRQIDDQSSWVVTRTFDEVLTVIPPEYWGVSKISAYGAVEQEHVNNPYTLPAHAGAWVKERNAYADLQVNWQQHMECWHTPDNASSDAHALTKERGAIKSDSRVRSAKRQRRKKRNLTKREADILKMLKADTERKLRGLVYCFALEQQKIPPSPEWIVDGCPMTYPEAYKLKKWCHRIQDEKSRLSRFLPKKRTRQKPPTSSTRRGRVNL